MDPCIVETFGHSSIYFISFYNSDVEIRAVVHDDGLRSIFADLPAELVAASIWKPFLCKSTNDRLFFDYKIAYVALLRSLEVSKEDFLFVIRLCPKLDENDMLVDDVLFVIEKMIVV